MKWDDVVPASQPHIWPGVSPGLRVCDPIISLSVLDNYVRTRSSTGSRFKLQHPQRGQGSRYRRIGSSHGSRVYFQGTDLGLEETEPTIFTCIRSDILNTDNKCENGASNSLKGSLERNGDRQISSSLHFRPLRSSGLDPTLCDALMKLGRSSNTTDCTFCLSEVSHPLVSYQRLDLP